MRPVLRWTLVGAAAAAIGVSWLPDEPEAPVVQAARRTSLPAPLMTAAAATRSATAAPLTSAAVTTDTAPQPARAAWPDLPPAARKAWVPPPPPAPPPPAPVVVPPPAPPPAFPYQWLGQLEDNGRLQVFLGGPLRTLVVKPGDELDQQWRVDGVDAGRLQITWLATGQAISVAARP